MKNRKISTIGISVLMTALLSLAGGIAFAAEGAPMTHEPTAKKEEGRKHHGPMTPEMAAKKENFRKQNEQRVTPEKRKMATDALKAERIKIYKAKQAAKAAGQPAPVTTDK